jgi:2-polyprenyl-3-methyl-5-hydroxy-6-metoxy-1,4-benzoquinol methylase
MNRLSAEMLQKMAATVSTEDRDEMAIPSYLHKNPAMRWMAWRRVEVVAKWMAEAARSVGRPDSTVMDFGCGTGVLFETATSGFSKVWGVDLQLGPSRLLVQERGYTNVTLLHPDDLEATIPAGSVDLVVAAEVLEHVDPLEPTLERFRTRLRPGGKLLVSLPTESGLYKLGRAIAGFKGDYHHHNAASIHKVIEASGFRTERKHKIPLPGPAAIYWVVQYAKV